MVTTSSDFQRAVANRNHQIALLIFSDCIFSNDDIRIDKGIEFHDYFNTEEDLCVGQALSNTISFTLYNDDRILNNYSFGEFTATIGVLTGTTTYVQHGPVTVKNNGVEWVGSQSRPYLKRAGAAVSSQPSFPVTSIGILDGTVYAFGRNGEYKVYTSSGSATSASVSAFMQRKASRWDNVGYNLNTSSRTLTKWYGGKAELYEFSPLGVFTANRPDAPDKIEIDFTCYDRMQKFEKDWNNKPGDWEDGRTYRTLDFFYNLIWQESGLSSSAKATIPSNNVKVFTRPKEFDNTLTLRNVLEWIAEAVGCNVKFDRFGKMQFVWVRSVTRTFNEGSYKTFDPYWYTTKQVTKVITRSTDKNKEGISGSGSGDEYLVQDNPFLQMFHDYVISQEDGPWKEGFKWEDKAANGIDFFDDEYYWDLERVKKEFSIFIDEEETDGEET